MKRVPKITALHREKCQQSEGASLEYLAEYHYACEETTQNWQKNYQKDPEEQ